ncbi:MAG: hypothetical protein KF718_01210 [Polyangiaceae bacterium]|nr:hypothetical protein [Polyangiaceae bacterium]
MTEPRPLLQGSADELEAALLGSARSDGPAPGACAKLVLALGASGATAAAAGAAEAAGSSSLTAAASPGAVSAGTASVANASLLSLGKWLGAGLLVGSVASTAATATFSAGPAPKRAAPITATLPPAPAREAKLAVTPSLAKEGPPTDLPSDDVEAPPPAAANVARSSAIAGSATPRAPARDADIVVELSLLDDARKALARGDGPEALRALEARRARVGAGSLEPESLVLRIEALFASGSHASATRAAREFLSAHAASPHATRVRSLLAKAERAASSEAGLPAAPKAAATTDGAPQPKQSTASFPLP